MFTGVQSNCIDDCSKLLNKKIGIGTYVYKELDPWCVFVRTNKTSVKQSSRQQTESHQAEGHSTLLLDYNNDHCYSVFGNDIREV